LKQALVSILISSVLVFIYAIVAFGFGPIISGQPLNPPAYLLAPLSLPWTIYYAVAPESLKELIYSNPFTNVLWKIFMYYFANVILYAIPIYLLLRFRKNKEEAKS